MKQATEKTFPQPNRAARRAAAYAADRAFFATSYFVWSIPQDDLGTAYRAEIDACLQKNFIVGVKDGAPLFDFRTKRGKDLANQHGVIIRHELPGDVNADVFIQATTSPYVNDRINVTVGRRLFNFGHALPGGADDRALEEAAKAEAYFDAGGTPEADRVGTAFLFFEDGWFVRVRRCAKGRYPTDWVIEDVSPTNRHSDIPDVLRRGFVTWVDDGYQGV